MKKILLLISKNPLKRIKGNLLKMVLPPEERGSGETLKMVEKRLSLPHLKKIQKRRKSLYLRLRLNLMGPKRPLLRKKRRLLPQIQTKMEARPLLKWTLRPSPSGPKEAGSQSPKMKLQSPASK